MATETFANRRVLVTGASRGIGLATARRFLATGARVALVAPNQVRLEQAAADLGQGAVTVPGDVSTREGCLQIAAAAATALGGPIDVLISNAGILRRAWVEEISEADFGDSIATNVGGGLWLAQALIPGMRDRDWGRIVLVSSELGLIGAPSYGAYCMSKFALVGLAETLAHELSGTGVRACVVCPGNVRTDQLKEEYAWGLGAGVAPEKALAPESVAETILRATQGDAVVVLADKPALKVGFDAMFAMPRGLRLRIVRDAYKALLTQRRRELSPEG